ncbi:hypothetical protein A0256_16395 [Mucilaginibacter sp. PAMC 26640]|nr:hypothetical protein A0256_16395 [Mucilaginibacter sp. PAMC 26640]
MRYAEWNRLTEDERKSRHWKHHPRIRIATIFSILFALVFVVVLLRVFQNRRMHVNVKPNKMEAFTISKSFVKDKLQQPQTASFPGNKFEAIVDTANSAYQISSSVKSQNSAGKIIQQSWNIKLSYTGGDWADRKSWTVKDLSLNP